LPVWMWRRFIKLPIINPLFRFFTLPLIALALFNGLFPIYHIPVIFDFSKASPTAHFIITLGLFIFAVFMWWPVVTPVKEMDVLQPLLNIGYLILSLFLVSIACALIIFADEPIYEAQAIDTRNKLKIKYPIFNNGCKTSISFTGVTTGHHMNTAKMNNPSVIIK